MNEPIIAQIKLEGILEIATVVAALELYRAQLPQGWSKVQGPSEVAAEAVLRKIVAETRKGAS